MTKRYLLNVCHDTAAALVLGDDGKVSDRQLHCAAELTCNDPACPCRRERLEVAVYRGRQKIVTDRIDWPSGPVDPLQRWIV